MKQSLWVILFYTLFFSGCSVVSFYPFFTSDKVVEHSNIVGNWTSHSVNHFNGLEWKFTNEKSNSKYQLSIWKDNVVWAKYEVTFFEIDDTLFADLFLKKHERLKTGCEHLVEMHTVAKVIVKKGIYEFIGLSRDWLQKELSRRPHLLKHIQSENRLLITANSRQLSRFLKRIAHNPDAFVSKQKITLLKIES
ncbi:hypothetical protein EMN47_07100 [Prolixibacteraceae bacterium JC049]|nr:hypothetical protein [Prolixibacteraceae bacterium JC049]